MSTAHPFRFYAGPSFFPKNLCYANLFWEPYLFARRVLKQLEQTQTVFFYAEKEKYALAAFRHSERQERAHPARVLLVRNPPAFSLAGGSLTHKCARHKTRALVVRDDNGKTTDGMARESRQNGYNGR